VEARPSKARRLPLAPRTGSTEIPRSSKDRIVPSAPTYGRCRSLRRQGRPWACSKAPAAAGTTRWNRRDVERGRGGGGAREGHGQGHSPAGTVLHRTSEHLQAGPSGDRTKLLPPRTHTCRVRRHVRTEGGGQAEALRQGGTRASALTRSRLPMAGWGSVWPHVMGQGHGQGRKEKGAVSCGPRWSVRRCSRWWQRWWLGGRAGSRFCRPHPARSHFSLLTRVSRCGTRCRGRRPSKST
jgi:hypothetical protein